MLTNCLNILVHKENGFTIYKQKEKFREIEFHEFFLVSIPMYIDREDKNLVEYRISPN